MAIDNAFCNSIYGSPRKRIVDRNNKHASEYMSVSVCLYRVRWNSFLSFCGNLHYCHRYDSFPHKRIILQCSLLLWFFHTPCKGSVAHTLLLPLLSFSSVQSVSRVWLSATPWTAACQASLSITNSQSSLKLMSIESVMPSSHLILSSPSPAPSPSQHQGLFQWVNSLHEVAKSIGVSASASVLPMNTQDWSPLGWTGWISLQSKGLSRVFSDTTVQKHQFFGTQFSL